MSVCVGHVLLYASLLYTGSKKCWQPLVIQELGEGGGCSGSGFFLAGKNYGGRFDELIYFQPDFIFFK